MILDNTQEVRLEILDDTGNERIYFLNKTYCKGSDACIIGFDITNKESFKHVEYWVGELSKNADENIVKCLVGYKGDLTEER